MESRESITERVVDEVADAEDQDPIELPPLQDVIETDAMNALFDTDRGAETAPIELCFCYSESIVTVHGDGAIDVTPHGPEAEAAIFHNDLE